MGVYIKNMKMPPRCGRCDMRISAYDDGMFDHYECCATAAIIGNLGEKMEDCPLVSVPEPHGRLIDADALLESIKEAKKKQPEISDVYDEDYFMVAEWVAYTPTIIPAEEGET